MTPHEAFWLRRRCSGAELAEIRRALGYTQEGLARVFRVTLRTITRMEKATIPNFAAEVILRGMYAQEAGLTVKFITLCKRLSSSAASNGKGDV